MTAAPSAPPPDETNLLIATAVNQLRDARGLSVDQLAVYAGLNRASLYRKLKGDFGWKATDVAALAHFFGVQPNDLFSGQPIGGLGEDTKRPELCAIRDSNPEPADSVCADRRGAVVIPFPQRRSRTPDVPARAAGRR